jgi:hypothetical protein
MPTPVEGLALVLLIAVIAAVAGVGFGIFLLAPRIARMLDRAEPDDEDPGERPD